MTADTAQTNPNPPAGDLQPVPVHVTGVAAGVQLAAAAPARRRIRTRFSTYVLTHINAVQNILPEDPTRIRAVVIIHGPVGQGATASSYGWLGPTKMVVTQAAADLGEQTSEGAAYVSAGGTVAVPFEFWGTDAVWAALDSAASTAMPVSVISDYDDAA